VSAIPFPASVHSDWQPEVELLQVELQRRVQAWSPPAREISRWASAALGRRAQGHEIGVRVVGRAESRRLNARFRGRDKPTNVLSFPMAAFLQGAAVPSKSAAPRPLGDLVICAEVLQAEAREQKKELRAHWAHLVVHGALHLIGYDHELRADAERMERREVRVLRSLGFANPYRSA
jgi:probable rRNA maturation factor